MPADGATPSATGTPPPDPAPTPAATRATSGQGSAPPPEDPEIAAARAEAYRANGIRDVPPGAPPGQDHPGNGTLTAAAVPDLIQKRLG